MAATGVQAVCFANRGTVTIVGSNATPTSTTFAVVKDVELTLSADHVPLYGWGSIQRVAVAKHQQKVQVKVGSMKFNPSLSTGTVAWWSYISNPSSGGTTNEDTNVVKLFTITANFVFEDGQTLTGTVYNVYFPNLPLRASEGQWVKLDMSGEGAYVTWSNP